MADPGPDSRYDRQTLFPPIGRPGQQRLAAAKAVIVGCGALGTTLAELLVRAGVGTLRLLDRDVVETSNLGRQALYTEADARAALPKAEALRRHLAAFNPAVCIQARVADLNPSTADDELDGVDLILDGSDNFETRYLINDYAVREGLPWIYGACVAARGMTAVILPGKTPCLRCLFPEPPAAGAGETCDTAGIIAPAATLVASLQAVEALKLLVGARDAVRHGLLSFELWPFRLVELGRGTPVPRRDCACCGARSFPWLADGGSRRTITYCGRNAVQVVPVGAARPFDLEALAARLEGRFPLRRSEYVLRVEIPEGALTVFDDGRALVAGTADAARARTLYDRYVGG